MTVGKPDPDHHLSAEAAAAIVASHDKLLAWNDANEETLDTSGDHVSTRVVENIRQLAAAVIASEKSLSSQNFQLRRALNLHDRTLQLSDVTEGMVAGTIHALADRVEPLTGNLTNPGSMNLADSQARSQALRDVISDTPDKLMAMAIAGNKLVNIFGNATIKLADTVWQQPGIVPAVLEKTVQARISAFRQDLHSSLSTKNPGYAFGAALGVTIVDVAGMAVNPVSKAQSVEKAAAMNWDVYRNLLGSGMYLPKHRPPLDFTDLMQVSAKHDEGVVLRIEYKPPDINHGMRFDAIAIQSHSDNSGYRPVAISYTIMALGDRDAHGTGKDMFHSAMEILRRNHLSATEFHATWMPSGVLGDNHKAFIHAYDTGMIPAAAAKCTFSGKCIGMYGLTEVGGDLFKSIVKDGPHDWTLTPIFTRPDFGEGQQRYGEAWVDAMGHSMRQLVPRVANLTEIKPEVDITGRLSAFLKENMTEPERAKVMQIVEANMKKHFDRISMTSPPEVGR